ncbi:MAG TPA: hypothetical protein VK095_03730 [Beutenbergiaceae bacterium]|nr:hypothetical protein [Beutenbergiaceae bacterium]
MMATRALTRLAPAPLKRWVRRVRTGPHRAGGAGEGLRAAYDYMARREIQPGVSNALIVQRALDRGVEVRAGRDGRVQLQFQGATAWFNASNSSLNRGFVKRVTGNKAVTGAFLRAEGIRAPENLVFEVDQVDRAWAWAEPILPVVVKPRRGQAPHPRTRSRRRDFNGC